MNKIVKEFNKGSITVEASFIMGLALFIVFTTISICFYIHNRAWYSAAASETAITAATYAVRKKGAYQEIINEKISDFSKGPGFPDSCKGLFSNSNKEQIKLKTLATMPIWMSPKSLQMNVEINSKVIRPTKFIRKIQSLQIIKEQIDAS